MSCKDDPQFYGLIIPLLIWSMMSQSDPTLRLSFWCIQKERPMVGSDWLIIDQISKGLEWKLESRTNVQREMVGMQGNIQTWKNVRMNPFFPTISLWTFLPVSNFHSEYICSKVWIVSPLSTEQHLGDDTRFILCFCFMLLHKVQLFKLYDRNVIFVSFLCCSNLNWK